MQIKSIIQDMKGEIGSISRKGFGGLRSRSHRVVQDSAVVVDALRQSCWANMPPELLRDVLMRIEASEDTWPPRKNVVACAGVCKSWREIMKEIVRVPEILGKLTFPISLKQPGPRDALIQCFIRRNRNNQTYHLYLSLNAASNDDGKFLLTARKCRRTTCTDYIISLNAEDVSKGSNTYIGKLRSNFLGTKFAIFDAQPPNDGAKVTRSCSTKLVGVKQVSPRIPVGNYPVAHISYELNVLGSRGPRRMQCIMDAIPASSVEPGGVAPTQTVFLPGNSDSFPSFPFFRSKSTRLDNIQSGSSPTPKDEMLVLKNKAPRWHEQLQCWCLNFNGRVTVASVKNFQLVASMENETGGQEHENVILQFGKVGKDVFTMDYQYPISAFQAFAICLSSFDTKIACE
ncbi:scaffold/adaptor protein [Lithospermum erythrorhizon]|uniref:Scaffold/adaptor protein n=1 Tax=Lithospermum erythrorhizon TaxID=34254 RepID=A0AAV3NMJ1_LITER